MESSSPAAAALFIFLLGLDLTPEFRTSPSVSAVSSAKTCGCRRISFALMASIGSSMVKCPASAAIWEKNTTCSSRSPSSSANSGQSRASMACITS